jgi:hypothetical protein
MSIQGRNAAFGSTVAVWRPTQGDDSITWAAVSGLSAIKLDLMPVTDEVLREVFGVDSKIEVMALDPSKLILKGDGLVVSAGTHTGSKFRVEQTLIFHKFTQLGLRATTETIA